MRDIAARLLPSNGARAGVVRIAVAALAIGLAACGGNPSGTVRPTPTPAPSATVFATPGSGCAQSDTPFAQAGADLQRAWGTLTYRVTVIPACSVLSGQGIPNVPLTNRSGLSDAQAQQVLSTFLRTLNIYDDAKGNADPGLMRDIADPSVAGNDYSAAAGGTRTQPQTCAFPARVTLLPISAADMTATTRGVYTSAGVGLWQVYSGPCTDRLTTSGGQVSSHTWLAAGSDLIAPIFGVQTSAGPLGPIWTFQGSTSCSNPTPADLATACSQVG